MLLKFKLSSWLAGSIVLCCVFLAQAANYYVATTGNNSNAGTNAAPFKTIQKAADVMRGGDTCYIHGGIYREFVQPGFGGSSESTRIVYKAFPNELPSLRGSEQITGWTNTSGNIWTVTIPDSFFGSRNPFTINVADAIGGALDSYSRVWHIGDVWIDGQPLKERLTSNAVTDTTYSWFTSHSGTTTTIIANFGGRNPNTSLTEVPTREMIFYPSVVGLNYITIDGLEFKQIANQWNEFAGRTTGCLSPKWGTRWTIQNCRISDAKTTGLTLGTWDPNDRSANPTNTDIELRGHHIIRNNIIERCGESGISANGGGASSSIFEGNLVQDINYKSEMGGLESAGIKLHWAIDIIIKDNIFRRVKSARRGSKVPGSVETYALSDDGGLFPALWLDWGGMNCRITGNVFYNNDRYNIYMELHHGPFLIDNNIFIGDVIWDRSEAVVYTHNLFLKSGRTLADDGDSRTSEWWQPHSYTRVGTGQPQLYDTKTFNNINIYPYVAMTTQTLIPIGNRLVSGLAFDYNVTYQDNRSADKSPTEGSHSIKDASFQPAAGFQDLTNGIKIGFDMNSKPADAQCTPINSASFTFPHVVAGIDNPDGTPLAVDRDMLGNARNTSRPVAGPFEPLTVGANEFTFTAGPVKTPGAVVYPDQSWNIAQRATPSASTGNGAAYLNDRQTGETAGRTFSASGAYPKYATFSFRYPQQFDKVNMILDYGAVYGPTSWDIEVSDDGSTWTKVGGSGTVSWSGNNWNQWGAKAVTFTQVIKKYVRIKFLSGPSTIALNEVEIFNTSAQPSGHTRSIQLKQGSLIKNRVLGSGKVSVYDMRGRLIARDIKSTAEIKSGVRKQGVAGQGAYLIVRETGSQKIVEKMIVSK